MFFFREREVRGGIVVTLGNEDFDMNQIRNLKGGRRLGPASPDALMLSPQQVADVLNTSRSTIDRMAQTGQLPGVVRYRQGKHKGMYSVNRKALEQWMEGRGRKK